MLLLTSLAASQPLVAQQTLDQPITLEAHEEALKTVLTTIERQASVHFLYSRQLIGANRRVTFSAARKPLADVLNELLVPLRIQYESVEDGIVLTPAVTNGTVTGRVLGANGEGIPGVTVLVEGTSLGGATDVSGSYTINNVPAGPHTLIVSSVGYLTQRLAFTSAEDGNVELSVTLAENATELNEAVVVGYGTTRRQDVTGSVTTVTTKDFVQGQVTAPEQLVQGKVAGVQITTGGGAPGEVSTIRIRGGSSLNASNDPLIVIDGVPVDNRGINGAGSPLALVNPNDIESFTVLKDASATAIYGSRASNGVIIITTKKGVDGEKMHVNFNSQVSRSTNYGKVDVLSGDEYRALTKAAIAGGLLPGTSADYLGTANTDWQDLIYRTAWTTDNTISLTGSLKHVPFRLSVGHLDQQGTLKTGYLKRNSVSVGLSPRLFGDHLRIDINSKGTWADFRFADQGAIGGAIRFNPTMPVYSGQSDFNGYYEWAADTVPKVPNRFADRNPLARLNDKRDRSTVLRSIGNVQLDYKLHFLPDLHANLNLGYDIARSNGSVFVPATSSIDYTTLGQNNTYRQDKDNKILETYLSYGKQIGVHRVDAVAGYSYQDFYTYSPYRFAYRADGSRVYPLSPAQNPYKTGYALRSYYGRVNYNFKDRYLFTGTLRADGSSHFSDENRWGLFPAASVAWRINQEDFLANSTTVSDLKLRASYGVTGQQDTGPAGDYPYLALYSIGAPDVRQIFGQDTIYTYKSAAYDRNLKWEETTTYDVGLDFGVFGNRLTGTVDVYLRRTRDLLAVIPIPALSNLSNTLFTNIGSLENQGVELALNYNVLQGEKLSWSVNANATFNRGKITKLSQVEDPTYLGTPTGGIGNFQFVQINAVGHAPNTFFLYQQRYDERGRPIQGETNSPTVAQYVDQNGDGIINERDKVYGKSPAPKAILGFSSNLSYGHASLAFTIRSNIGGYVYNGVNGGQGNLYGFNTGLGFSSNVVPAVYTSLFSTGQPYSDLYLEDASFVRLQNVTVGYDFGSLLKSDTNLRLTLAGQNLLLLTRYGGLDPERAYGIDTNFYPLPRTITLGLNLGF